MRKGKEVDFEELRDNVDELLDRVEAKEAFVITHDGKPVADLVPHSADASVNQL
jgi:prevent-host-death family protein